MARIGEEVRLARVSLGLTVHRASRLAGVSWSTAARVEAGDPDVGVETLCALAEAVGVDVVLRAYPGRQPSLRDSGQLAVAENIRAVADAAWQSTLELPIGEHGAAVDMVLFGPNEIIAVEIERTLADWQAQYRRADQKRRALAAQHARAVRLVLVVEDTRRNRALLAPVRSLLDTALPARSRDVIAALRSGRPLRRDGLLWVRRRRPPGGGSA